MITTEVRTDVEPFALTQIPCHALERLGTVFREGERKYGKDNWQRGVDHADYQEERANHALKHLLYYVHWLRTGECLGERHGEAQEDALAKVAWFCVTQMELERLESLPTPTHEVPHG